MPQPARSSRPNSPVVISRWALARLSLQMHGRSIVIVGVLLSVTATLAVLGVLRTLPAGEPVERPGIVTELPSQQSDHVLVRVESGEIIRVRREGQRGLSVGTPVIIMETVSWLDHRSYRLAMPTREMTQSALSDDDS